MKKIALVVVVLGLGLLGAFWMTREARSSSAAATPVAAPSAQRARQAVELDAPQLPPPAEPEARAAVARHEDVRATEAAGESSAPLQLSGTIVVLDEQGVEHATEDGFMRLELWSGDDGSSQRVAVEHGAWSTAISRSADEPPVDALGAGWIELDKRVAVLEPEEDQHLAISADRRLALRALWLPDTLLHVRALDTGLELAPVVVEFGGEHAQNLRPHPGLIRRPRLDFANSPLRLDPTALANARVLYVSSPGYAWGRIELDVSAAGKRAGGERFVELERGGDLDVILDGQTSDPGAMLRLYRSDSSSTLVAEAALAGENQDQGQEHGQPEGSTMSFEGLAPGVLHVKAEIGISWDAPLQLGEATADVRADITAGARTSVRLAFAAPAPIERVPLAGVVSLPSEWQLTEFTLSFALLDTPIGGAEREFSIESSAMHSDAAAPELHRWTAGLVQPGRYDVKLDELAFHAVFEVPTSGLTDARFEVPPPCEVSVRCVNEDTRADVVVSGVSWYSTLPEVLHGWRSASGKWDESMQRWRLRAPVAPIHLSTFGQQYAGELETALHLGWNELELPVQHLAGLTLVFRDGATSLRWQGEYPTLEPAEGQDQRVTWASDNGHLSLFVRQPGRYTLKVPAIPGYEPVLEEVVWIEKGVVKEHVIELHRKP